MRWEKKQQLQQNRKRYLKSVQHKEDELMRTKEERETIEKAFASLVVAELIKSERRSEG